MLEMLLETSFFANISNLTKQMILDGTSGCGLVVADSEVDPAVLHSLKNVKMWQECFWNIL
jgi:hypothetical protein